MEKLCNRCKKSKSLSEWNRNVCKGVNGTQAYCKECTRELDRISYHRNHRNRKVRIREKTIENSVVVNAFIREIKKGGCSFCPEKEPFCMDFHHLRDKDFSIGDAIRLHYSLKRVKIEIEKCLLVCSNCHRKIHAGLIVSGGAGTQECL